MFEYMRTVLNGLKAWVTGEVNKLLSKIDAAGAAASRASNAAAKNKKNIAALRYSLSSVTDTANSARSNAKTAQIAADTAQNTANAAKTAAETAQSTAETAQSTAETCVRAQGWPYDADADKEVMYRMLNNRSNKDVHVYVGSDVVSALKIHVGEETAPSVTFIPPVYGAVQANFEFSRVSSEHPHPLITGIGGVVMHSSDINSNKKFKITVDDAGMLSATEVTT